MKGRTSIKLLTSSAARFGYKSKVENKHSETLFSLMPKGGDVVTVFNRAIAPVLPAFAAFGKVGVRIVGIDKKELPAMLAEIEGKWKWFAMGDGSVLVMPRDDANGIQAEHVASINNVVARRENVRAGIGAIVRV